MKSIQIDRLTWLRGGKNMVVIDPDEPTYNKYEDSMLLREDGLMCCIGQACRQLGVPAEAIDGKSTVDELSSNLIPEEFQRDSAESLLSRAYGINDDEDTTDAEKEEKLVPLFAELGLNAMFIN